MTDADRRTYLLGTHDEELQRLGLQHHVWRPRVLDCWRRAGITAGWRVIDAGAGPGWATADLAESVGRTGEVWALERSDRYFEYLTERAKVLGLPQVRPHQLDLVTDDLPVEGADAFWIRWVLAFIPEPERVLAKLAAALKPGGVAIIHEYVDWGTHSLLPSPKPAYESFVQFVLDDWRASGGEPDIGRRLPDLCPAAGLRIREVRALGEIAAPTDVMWRWTSSFVRGYAPFLADSGKRTRAWADAVVAEIDEAERDPRTLVVTPYLMEVIAEKV